MAGKYALLIGNSEYTGGFARLQKAKDDVLFLKELLEDSSIGGFNEVITEHDIDNTQLKRLIGRFFQGRSKNDTVLLYYSGHGWKDEKGVLRLVGVETDKDETFMAVDISTVTDFMDTCSSDQQIMVLDCCYSGALFKGEAVAAGTEKALGSRGTGRLILTATDAVQYALQSTPSIGDTPNSVFTHFLVQVLREGLKDKGEYIKVRDWFEAAAAEVAKVAPQQSPRLFSRNESFDIFIARNTYRPGGAASSLVGVSHAGQEELLLEFRRGGLIQATWNRPKLPKEVATHQVDVTALDDQLSVFLSELDAGALDGDRSNFMKLGERLFDTLCPGEVGGLVSRAVGASGRQERLRVYLHVDPDFGPAGRCPPEFLWVPADPERKDRRWLSYDNRVAIARRCAGDPPTTPQPPHDPPIRVLFVVSMPRLPAGNFTQVADRLKKWTHNLVKPPQAMAANRMRTEPRGPRQGLAPRAQSRGQKPLVEITLIGDESLYRRATRFAQKWDRPASWGEINHAIDQLAQLEDGAGLWQPDIIHFAGFGDIDGDDGFLVLQHEDEDSDRCSVWDLRDLIERARWHPRLVILEPCASGDAERDGRTTRGFMAMAEALVRLGTVENAITFQFPPVDRDQKHIGEFLARCYAQLAGGQPIDVAVQEGRAMITTVDSVRYSRRIFGAPVLFARDSSPLLQTTRPARGPELSTAARSPARAAQKPRDPVLPRAVPQERAAEGGRTAAVEPLSVQGQPPASHPPSSAVIESPNSPIGGPP